MKKSLRLILPTLLAVLALNTGRAAIYTVNNLNDSGSGSLRKAILDANANPGSVIRFSVNGTIKLSKVLPDILKRVTIDGSTAPGFVGDPVISVDFGGKPGLVVSKGADQSVIGSLSLVRASNAAITLVASKVTVQGNFIGLAANSTVAGNYGDGIRINSPSGGNLIGHSDPVVDLTYYNTANVTAQETACPVTAWQGLRNYGNSTTDYLICGTSGNNGLLYIGPTTGNGTKSYLLRYPGVSTNSTSVYGPDNLPKGYLRLVGSYKITGETSVYNHGFVWTGTTANLASGDGTWETINYPRAKYQYTHSTMGGLAVGNADQPTRQNAISPGIAYIYDIANRKFVANIVFPGSKSNTAYGIWYNGGTKYTICGGYSPIVTNNLANEAVQSNPLGQGKGYLVDYDSSTGKFSNWASFDYPNGPAGVSFVTHFEGISSIEPGVYTLSADSLQSGSSNPAQG